MQLALQDFSNSVSEFQVQEESQVLFKMLAFLNQQRMMFQVGACIHACYMNMQTCMVYGAHDRSRPCRKPMTT